MAPVLFYLCARLLVERWIEQIQHIDSVEVQLRFRFDGNCLEGAYRMQKINESQFADGTALLATAI